MQEHAAIAVRRGSAPAHAEIWRRLPQGAAIVCLVAEDRPGLVASLATALTAQSIDILAAHVYSRSGPSGAEAVEFLWLRRDEAVAPTLLENDVARFADLLSGLLNGELRIDGRVGAERHLPSPDVATLVRVEPGEESRKPALFSLGVPARAGIFRAVHQAVLRANFQVIAHRRVGAPGGRESLRFAILDADGRAPTSIAGACSRPKSCASSSPWTGGASSARSGSPRASPRSSGAASATSRCSCPCDRPRVRRAERAGGS